MNLSDVIATCCHAGPRFAAPLSSVMGYMIHLEQAHFLAQLLHESGGFEHVEENLNYSGPRLLQVFPSHFTPAEAMSFAHDRGRIANRIYANRMGNGDEASGDGYRFRGRGLIQLTGRDNYTACGHEHDPDRLAIDIPTMCSVALWFWQTRRCAVPALRDDLVGVTKLINGGLNGLTERGQWLARVKRLLSQ